MTLRVSVGDRFEINPEDAAPHAAPIIEVVEKRRYRLMVLDFHANGEPWWPGYGERGAPRSFEDSVGWPKLSTFWHKTLAFSPVNRENT